MCDSSSTTCLSHNPFFHERAKHIKVRHHFLRDHVEKGEIEIKFIDTERQLTDIFTKPLDSSCFALFAFLLHFLHTHLSHVASPVILACICSIMLIIVLDNPI
jgi:hypothetical protein